ncbi:MAG TPA: MFS transporter, partial [Sedimentisphaerales bacterium]|nr:MFS transporter [Sedimentisphaerales bacterium]
MEPKMYLLLSSMMFLEYAVWGAWAPVLASRLFGPLKMSGKQTGWIYGTIPLACLVSPIIAGQMADQWIASKWILVFAHFVGAVLLFVSSKKEKFGPLFVTMMLYSLLYSATMPLVNSLMFANLTDAASQSPLIFIWAPIGWVLV